MVVSIDKSEIIIQSEEDLLKCANILLQRLGGHKKVALYGNMAAGKTSLVKALSQLLKVRELANSPTYSLINEYSYLDTSTKQEAFVFHMDLYRLKSKEEAIDIGIEDYLYGPEYCFIEWPDIIEDILPEDIVKIKIEIIENSSRKIIFL